MDAAFDTYLKQSGRSPSAAKRIKAYVAAFAQFLETQGRGSLAAAGPDELETFVTWIETSSGKAANSYLWALIVYFEFTGNEALARLAGILREARIKRQPLPLHQFLGVDTAVTDKLAAVGIHHVNHMRQAGATPAQRQALAAQSGVAAADILELVKLADLARIPGLKSVRARLYYAAGVDTVEKLAGWEPAALHAMLADFVARTGFEGIAPFPAEVRHAVASARKLKSIVSYS